MYRTENSIYSANILGTLVKAEETKKITHKSNYIGTVKVTATPAGFIVTAIHQVHGPEDFTVMERVRGVMYAIRWLVMLQLFYGYSLEHMVYVLEDK